jgi:carbonic anhydrase
VIRNAGNTAFTEAIASVEYSVSVLKTPLLMVMGHSGCGAVTAAMDTNPLTPSLERLIQPIRENISGSSDLAEAVKRNALASASTLIQRSAVLADAKASGALKLVVGCFQLSSGVVSLIE